jgi:uncharacterized BrkB/YihY/UPF0761 family membrane protein
VGFLWRNSWRLFLRSFVLAYEDGCFSAAKGAAYSALLSFFPLLTATATILVQIRGDTVSGVLSRALARVVPPGTEQLVLENFRVRGARPAALLVAATLVSIWAASRMMSSLMEGFQAIYHVPAARPFLRQQGMAILLVLATALPLLAASGLVLFGNRTEQLALRWLGLLPAGQEIEGATVDQRVPLCGGYRGECGGGRDSLLPGSEPSAAVAERLAGRVGGHGPMAGIHTGFRLVRP